MRFAVSQVASFAIPLRDLSYLFCYYINYVKNNNDLSNCQTPTNFLVHTLLALFPSFLALMQVNYYYFLF